MGFWKRLLGKGRNPEPEEQWDEEQGWEELVYDFGGFDLTDGEQRRQYVTDWLEQAADASRELELLNGEYSRVTAYLTDIEEIEALPPEERDAINGIARRMLALVRERERYQNKKNRMKDSDYYRMRQQEPEVQEGIEKLRECEHYGELVRQDMQRLDRERHAYAYRKTELENMLNNYRGMAVIFLSALAACVVLLLIMQFAFDMNTQIGYIISVGAAALAITVLFVKYTDAEREKSRVEKAANKLILLQNKVKIRYVNNRNLWEYLQIKYNTKSAEALEKLWKLYQQEKEERKQYAEAEAKLDYYQKQLVEKLRNYRITDPDRWMNQPAAFLDKREMVEIRHELILRRQALRKQMDYNKEVAEKSRKEIMDMVKKYPSYATEVMALVDRYDQG